MGSDQLLGELLPVGRDQASDDEIVAAHAALYSVYWPRLRPLPGAARLLRACHKHGLRVVLASSAGDVEKRASQRLTWCRSRFRRLAPVRNARCSWATPSGTRKPAGGPAFRASAC